MELCWQDLKSVWTVCLIGPLCWSWEWKKRQRQRRTRQTQTETETETEAPQTSKRDARRMCFISNLGWNYLARPGRAAFWYCCCCYPPTHYLGIMKGNRLCGRARFVFGSCSAWHRLLCRGAASLEVTKPQPQSAVLRPQSLSAVEEEPAIVSHDAAEGKKGGGMKAGEQFAALPPASRTFLHFVTARNLYFRPASTAKEDFN